MAKEKELKQMIQILAMNLEVLNQKLNNDPDALDGSVDMVLREKMVNTEEKLDFIQNVIKSTHNDIKAAFEREQKIQTQVDEMTKNLDILGKKIEDEMTRPTGTAPGGAALGKNEISKMQDKLDAVGTTVAGLQEQITQIDSTYKETNEKMDGLVKEGREFLTEEVEKLKGVTDQIENVDTTQIEEFTKTGSELNRNLTVINDIYLKIFRQIKKENVWMMGLSTALSSAVSLIVIFAVFYFIQ